MLRQWHPLCHRRLFLPILPSNVSPQPPFLFPFDPTPYSSSSIRTSPVLSPSSSHASPLRCRLRLRCSGKGEDEAGPEGTLKGFVDEQVEDLLRKKENRALMDGLEDASRRVEAARRALADIERQEAEVSRAKEYVLQLESRLAEIEETQRDLEQAGTMVEEAEHSLSSNMDSLTSLDAFETNETEKINKEMERSESIKAALISSAVGTLAALPISFYQVADSRQLIAHLAVIFISCALFGVTYRYTVRRCLDNVQLKTGTCAAFGFVRGLSAAEASKPWEFNSFNFLPLAVDATTCVLEGTFIFIFSSVALDYCIKMGFLSPFPIKE